MTISDLRKKKRKRDLLQNPDGEMPKSKKRKSSVSTDTDAQQYQQREADSCKKNHKKKETKLKADEEGSATKKKKTEIAQKEKDGSVVSKPKSLRKKKKRKGRSSDYFKDLWTQFVKSRDNQLLVSPSSDIPDSCVCTRIPSEKVEENKFLELTCPEWSEWIKKEECPNGAPFSLLIAPGALRSIQLNRQLLPFKSESCTSAKLFSKHMKKDAQAKFLRSRPVHWGFGTPKRMEILVDDGALSLDCLRLVILDFNHRDEKDRRLCDMKETRMDTFNFLGKHILPLLRRQHNPPRLILL